MLYHLNVKTTTYPERHTKKFEDACALFKKAKYTKINILQVGPGMALRGIGRFNNIDNLKIIKRLETGLRRIPFPVSCYESYEPKEVLSIFSDLNPQLTVADISQKSLDVVDKTVLDENLSTVNLDLTTSDTKQLNRLKNKFDLIVCLATVIRTGSMSNRRVACKNLNSFAKDKSIIISESGFSDFGFSRPENDQVWIRNFS